MGEFVGVGDCDDNDGSNLTGAHTQVMLHLCT